MNLVAIVLVIISAFLHSFWNLQVKKSKNKVIFTWYIVLFSVILYLPLFLYFVANNQIRIYMIGEGFITLSAFFILFIFTF